jgi:glucose-6-phosphate dehydrogenase assembly protein OpcA
MSNHTELETRSVVNVHDILDELEQLRWGQHDDNEAAEHAAAEARASVLNLIAVVMNEAELGKVERVLDGLSVMNPSRTLLLLAQHDRDAPKLEGRITGQTRTETGHRVTTERVLLHAHGEVALHLASLVTPLLIPDLPVILWWPGRPDFDSPLFDALCELADRLVVDTDEGFEDRDMRRLLEVARRHHASASIGDFNWARLIPFRHLTAQFFDMPGMLAQLTRIQGVTVHHGADGSTTQARLMAGWIKGRMATVNIEVPVDLHRDEEFEHGVSRMVVYTRGEEGTGRFTVRRLKGGRLCAEVRIGDQDLVSRTVRFATRPAEELLAIELTLPGHDVLFEEALAAAVS